MPTDAEMTLLRYLLIVDQLDEDGEGFVSSLIGYLRVRVFVREPFFSWSDTERMRTAIEAISSLGHDGLVAFWNDGSHPARYQDFQDWIRGHRLSMSDLDSALERLTPAWWNGDWQTEIIQCVTTDAGAALFDSWFYLPPPEIKQFEGFWERPEEDLTGRSSCGESSAQRGRPM